MFAPAPFAYFPGASTGGPYEQPRCLALSEAGSSNSRGSMAQVFVFYPIYRPEITHDRVLQVARLALES